MCLSTVDNLDWSTSPPTIVENPSEEGIGWKIVFEVDNEHFRNAFASDPVLEYGRWIEAIDPPMNENPPYYKLGFHIFEKEKDAKWAVKEHYHRPKGRLKVIVVKCHYKHVLAKGKTFIQNSDVQSMDGYLPTIVAKMIAVEAPPSVCQCCGQPLPKVA